MVACRVTRGVVQKLGAAGTRRAAGVSISAERLHKFVNAEINYFAQKSPQPVELAQILKASSPWEIARLIQEKLPGHFATRIKHLETLPHWNQVPEVTDVHAILTDSFRNLRLLEDVGSREDDLKPIAEVVGDLRLRHKKVVPLLADAIAHIRYDDLLEEKNADDWLDTFLAARISTEMLTLHFTTVLECYLQNRDDPSVCSGIVDRRCDPEKICLQAVENVKAQEHPTFHGVEFHVAAHNCTASGEPIEFSFLPRYLLTMMEELLKNSAWATLGCRNDDERELDAFPVSITIGANQQQVMIKISDRGGGISESAADKLWSYAWSEKKGGLMKPTAMLKSFDDPMEGLRQQRLGMGLPLCRLYAQYLGGSLKLMSVPGAGVDTYLSLQRIDPAVITRGDDTST